jgi:hypothetical protein
MDTTITAWENEGGAHQLMERNVARSFAGHRTIPDRPPAYDGFSSSATFVSPFLANGKHHGNEQRRC